MENISRHLNEIAQLLELCEYNDRRKIDSLKMWSNSLLEASSKQIQLETLSAIQKVIAGMNSLSDIRLSPPRQIILSASEANQQLYTLILELDGLVREKLKL